MARRAQNLACWLVVLTVATSAFAGPRVLPEGQRPEDARLKKPKDLNGYFPFEPPATAEAWERRARDLRQRLLVVLGLSPMPTATPLEAVIHGKKDMGEYTVEKVYFQSIPGFYVTGNLFRPAELTGKVPAVLCPHGHWRNGRFYDAGEKSNNDLIKAGAEKFDSGRNPMQARCVQLARMGCVVFQYDMIGYADSQQITQAVAHGFRTQRPEMIGSARWGLFSPQAESHYHSVMGLQTYNSMRSIDFVNSLPEVDPKRIAVTGASGGGTQTFILCAVDPRPAVSIPAVMVSTAMQGGCTCENCCGLRIGTGNVELAGLFAPKPMALTAANDWTKEMSTKGFPQLKELYARLKVPGNVMLTSRTEFGHNYNYVSRAATYRWINQHFKMGIENTEEKDYKRLTREDITVWNAKHPQPEGGPDFERKLLDWLRNDAQQQLDQLAYGTNQQWRKFREVVGGGIDAVIRRRLPDASDLEYQQTIKNEHDAHLEIGGLLKNAPQGEAVPILFLHPKDWNGHVVIWASQAGKSGMYRDGKPLPPIQKLVDQGVSVVGIDLIHQGEFLSNNQPLKQTPRVDNIRESASYTLGYNDAVFAQRVHDLLNLIAFVRNHEYTPKSVSVVGVDGSGPWVAAARAQARDAVDHACIHTAGFRFLNVKDIRDPDFLPGGSKYHDLPGMIAIAAPDSVWVSGETVDGLKIVRRAYEVDGAGEHLTIQQPTERLADSAAGWLLEKIK